MILGSCSQQLPYFLIAGGLLKTCWWGFIFRDLLLFANHVQKKKPDNMTTFRWRVLISNIFMYKQIIK
jgi:hypothetical protein